MAARLKAHTMKLLRAHWFQATLSGLITGVGLFFFRELLASSWPLKLLADVLPGIVALLVAAVCMTIPKLINVYLKLTFGTTLLRDSGVRVESGSTQPAASGMPYTAPVANIARETPPSKSGLGESSGLYVAVAGRQPDQANPEESTCQEATIGRGMSADTVDEVLAYPSDRWNWVAQDILPDDDMPGIRVWRWIASLFQPRQKDDLAGDRGFVASRQGFDPERNERTRSIHRRADPEDEDLDEQILERVWSMGGCPHF
jgi:hypothetical protein